MDETDTCPIIPLGYKTTLYYENIKNNDMTSDTSADSQFSVVAYQNVSSNPVGGGQKYC